jgi:deazaflavin-dependent oxidoreductase (nitroreductase family)
LITTFESFATTLSFRASHLGLAPYPAPRMPLSRRVARFNKHVTNHVTGPFAGWLPGFAVVAHVGRRSGTVYHTPVNVFRVGNRYVFALTYGPGADWVRNVLTAGRCEIRTRGRTVPLVDPAVFTDSARRPVPMPARWILGLVGVEEFLALRPG